MMTSTMMLKFSLVSIVLVLFLSTSVNTQNFVSPCPRFFSYEENTRRPGLWYGTVVLLNDAELYGVWLKIILDRPAIQLGISSSEEIEWTSKTPSLMEQLRNWFGQIRNQGKTEHLIMNPTFKLKQNTAKTVRFYIKYDPNQPAPQLVSFRLNARQVCPEGAATTPPPPPTDMLFTSAPDDGQSLGGGGGSYGGQPQGGGGGSYGGNGNQGGLGNQPQNNIQPLVINSLNNKPDYFVSELDPSRWQVVSRPLVNKIDDTKKTKRCGTTTQRANPLISGGQQTSPGDFPWHAALYLSEATELSYLCGGTLVSHSHIITAAHCVTKPQTFYAKNPQNFLVYLGKYNLRKYSNTVVENTISNIYIHPKFDPTYLFNDIAILKLSKPVTETDFIKPICLWEENPDLNLVIGKLGTVIGWGFNENNEVVTELRKGYMPVISKDLCISSNPEFFSRYKNQNAFCAGYINGTTVCNGDSGGGLILPKAGTSGVDTVWQLRGVVSIGVAHQGHGSCDTSHYSVFTDAAKYSSWIQSYVDEL